MLSSPAVDEPVANLGALVRVAVWNALSDRLAYEKRRPVVQLHADGAGDDERDPLSLIPGREPEPGVALEVADELAPLMRRGGLTKAQQAKLRAVTG